MKTKEVVLPKLTKREQEYFEILDRATVPVMRGTFENLHENAYNSNVVDVHMMNLRRKLAGLYEITTLRSLGYSMQKV